MDVIRRSGRWLHICASRHDLPMSRKSSPHSRRHEAEAYRRLYLDERWRGPHGIRKQALRRDLYTVLAAAALDAFIANSLGEDEQISEDRGRVPH